mmetsp:Transcript_23886/g.56434  ORF Transcript_23886/g.56434 Transcript_23886/m.56434 type:complete len:240 (+) Transcript_23886:175-894(+)
MESTTTKKPYGRSVFGRCLLLALTWSTIDNPVDALVTAPAALAARPAFGGGGAVFMSSDGDAETDGGKNEDEIARMEQELKIAKLEAELVKLKEGKAETAAEASADEGPPPPKNPIVVTEEKPPQPLVESEDEETISLEDASMDMFLSEGWKEARSGYDPKNTSTKIRQTEEQNNAFGLIAKVVAGLVAAVVFSQIPVGQEDLSKYSAIKSTAPKVSIDLGDINRVKGQKIDYNDEDDS